MSEFENEITDRVARASAGLEGARQEGNDFLVEVHTGELEELARVAASHDVRVPGLHETLATTTGSLPVIEVPAPMVVDLRDRRVARSS